MKKLALILIIATPVQCAGAPPSKPAKTTTAPSKTATTAPVADPVVVKILEDQEKAGEKYRTIRADVEYTVTNPTLDSSEKRTGWVAYQRETKKTSAKIRIRFKTLSQEGGAKIREKVDYAFDGEWGITAPHKTRNMTKYQVAPPGEKIPAMQLGKGPLPPLPFGQKKAEVLKHFKPETRKLKPSDPKNTVYLKLTARREYREELDFSRLEIWIDRKTHLPVKIVGKQRNNNVQTVVLTNFKTNLKLKDEIFSLPTRGWKVHIKPYEQ